MSRTITGVYGVGITLSSPTDSNPVEVAATATIASTDGVALLGSGDAAWNIVNAGSIAGSSVGVSLPAGGALTNGGSISASQSGGTGFSFDPTTRLLTPLSGGALVAGGSIVNLAGGHITGGFFGAAGGSIENHGVIEAVGSGVSIGIALTGDGALDNLGGASVHGGTYGVLVSAGADAMVTNAGQVSGGNGGIVLFGAGTVINQGSADATATQGGAGDPSGIAVQGGGLVFNDATGHVTSRWKGVEIGRVGSSAGGTLVNAGFVSAFDPITGSGAAAWIHGSGLIDNEASGTIQGGPYGVVAYYDTIILNRGSIGGTQFAVFQSSAAHINRVEMAPGARFSGLVEGGATQAGSAQGTLELMAGAGQGAVTGFGTQYLNFGVVAVDAGADWSLDGTVAASQTISFGAGAHLTLAHPGQMAGTLAGFTDATLVLQGVGDVTSAIIDANERLTVSTASGDTLSFQLDAARHDAPGAALDFIASAAGSVLIACFAEGTRIETPDGPRPVETLAAGDRVASPFGGSQEVVWVGHRDTDCRRHPNPQDVWPVRIAAHAFGPGRPARDLWLSPDHGVFAGGGLIPARCLLNGRTITQERRDRIAYWHVELPRHDLLLAEGLACESYLDTGNRSAFVGGGPALDLHPDFARRAWEAKACAPQLRGGPALDAVRALLGQIADQLPQRRRA